MIATAIVGTKSCNWFSLCLFPAAYAADVVIRHTEPVDVPIAIWAWVIGLSLLGWFASSAKSLAGWVNGETSMQKLENRLLILKGLVAAMTAGVAVQLLGLYAGTPNVLNFLAVIGASYAGESFIVKRLGGDGSGRVEK